MSIIVKLSDAVDSWTAMQVFAQKEMPAKAAYRISKLVKKVHNELKRFEDARRKAIEKHGEKMMKTLPGKKEQQEVTEVKAENVAAFNAEIQALLDTEVELEGCAKIAFEDLEKVAGISPAVLSDLGFVIDEPAEAKAA